MPRKGLTARQLQEIQDRNRRNWNAMVDREAREAAKAAQKKPKLRSAKWPQ